MPQVLTLLRLSCLGVFFCLTCPTLAAEFSGQVVGVIDGDDVVVLHNGLKEDVRLNGIDCPEKGQAYGERAKEFTTRLAFRKVVRVLVQGSDAFGRTLGEVVLPDGRVLNHELVKAGLAWWFRQYAPENAEVARLEKEAREAKRGLWRDSKPLPPWVFRKIRRGQPLDPSDFALLDQAPPALEAVPGGTLPTPQPAIPTFPIIGNRRSRIYHRPDCPNYSQVSPDNRVEFSSAAEAEAAGYRLARNCPVD